MNIAENEVHLWYARDQEITRHDLVNAYRAILSLDELRQQARFHFEKHRHQYLITRALVRGVLSLYNDATPPEAWQFGRNKYNKPHIINPPFPFSLNFNISHTDELIVLAVSRPKFVGIDIENIQRRGSGIDIAEKYFSKDEIQDLRALPAERRKDRFLALWTLKEAYIKARGMGLAIPLNSFGYCFQQPGEVRIWFDADNKDYPQYWHLWQIEAGETHIAAVAVYNTNTEQQYRLIMREIIPLESITEIAYPIIARSRLERTETA